MKPYPDFQALNTRSIHSLSDHGLAVLLRDLVDRLVSLGMDQADFFSHIALIVGRDGMNEFQMQLYFIDEPVRKSVLDNRIPADISRAALAHLLGITLDHALERPGSAYERLRDLGREACTGIDRSIAEWHLQAFGEPV